MATRVYDLAALVLLVYARTRYRVRALGAPLELRHPSLVVATHRREDDAPVLVGALYPAVRRQLGDGGRVHFAVRDDLFERGFFAGCPPRLALPLRRLLWPLDMGPVLKRFLACHPAAVPDAACVVQLLRAHPDAPLDELLPRRHVDDIRARARATGLEPPESGRAAVRPEYGDLLWRWIERDQTRDPRTDEWWRRRRLDAVSDFRGLVDVLRAGSSLFVSPEGRASPDGTIGPLVGGLGALARRGAPRALVPLALAYDPLTAGRARAYVGIGAPADPRLDADATLALLRRTTPLTVGSSFAAALAHGADPEQRLAHDVEEARREGRPHEPELALAAVRRERLAEARRAARGRDLARLVNEYLSAREMPRRPRRPRRERETSSATLRPREAP